MKICLQLAWKNLGNEDTINIIKIWKRMTAMKNTQKKVKLKLLYDFLWNKFVQKVSANNKAIIEYPHYHSLPI